MDKTAVIAHQSLDILREMLPKDASEFEETHRVFQLSQKCLEYIFNKCQKEAHESLQVYRRNQGRTSPCPCSQCNPDDEQCLIDSTRLAIEVEAGMRAMPCPDPAPHPTPHPNPPNPPPTPPTPKPNHAAPGGVSAASPAEWEPKNF